MGKIIGIPYQSTPHFIQGLAPSVYGAPLLDMGFTVSYIWENAKLKDCSGFLLPGSFTDVVCGGLGRVDLRLFRLCKRIVQHAVQNKLPVLGICYGFQFLCNHFGGQVANVRRYRCIRHWRNWWQEQFDQEQSHTVESVIKELNGVEVNSSHRQGVVRLSKAMTTLAWAPDGFIEAMQHETLPIVGFQWHPERELWKPFNAGIFETFKTLVEV